MTIELFRCLPLSCSLTRSSCAQRHEAARGSGVRRPGERRPDATACRDCPVGLAHASGLRPTEWPDGTPIAPASTAPAPTAATTTETETETEGNTMAKAKTYTLDGTTRTIDEWAKVAGISGTALRLRLSKARGEDAIRAALTSGRSDSATKRAERERVAAVHETKRRTKPPRATRIQADGSPMEPKLEAAADALKGARPTESASTISTVVEAMGLTVVHAGLAPNGRRLVMVIELDGSRP